MPQSTNLSVEPQGVEAYYTNVEHLRDLFNQMLLAPSLSKRLLIIHGVGGVGKSSLLRMFRLHCKGVRVPVALASGDDPDVRSTVDVLAEWADELKAQDVKLPSFAKDYQHRRALQARVDSEASKVAKKAGTAVAKTAAETALSTIPGLGPILGKLGGVGVEALMDWLLGKGFTKPDVDLLLDPEKRLTDDFLEDLSGIASTQRVVLMLDTYEQMTTYDNWMRECAQRLHPNVLLVIAGREMVNWDRLWPGWLAHAEPHALEPMTPGAMRELVRRYYATQVGGEPDPVQVEKIIRFARGLPMAVTTAVRLWVKYRHEVQDFEEVEANVLDELVRRLREGVPSAMVPLLEAAATVRYFNKEILRAVADQKDIDVAYGELRRFPFVKGGKEAALPILRMHDSVREFLDRGVHVDDPERYRELHRRAEVYFETRLSKATGEETERLGLERLYHRVCVDEDAGVVLFQEVAEELVRNRITTQLRSLLNDVVLFPFEKENSRAWQSYYQARLMHLTGQIAEAEQQYEDVASKANVDAKLRSYALCDLGSVLVRTEYLGRPGGPEKAFSVIKQCQRTFGPEMDRKIVFTLSQLRSVYNYRCEWSNSLSALSEQLAWMEQLGDRHGKVWCRTYIIGVYMIQGMWKEVSEVLRTGIQELSTLPNSPFLRARLLQASLLSLIWSGRYQEAVHNGQEAREFAFRFEEVQLTAALLHDLAYGLGKLGKYLVADEYFSQSIGRSESLGKFSGVDIAIALGFRGEVNFRKGEWVKAKSELIQSFELKLSLRDQMGIPEIALWLGELHETQGHSATAQDWYHKCLDYRWTGRRYFECAALTGLMRVRHAQKDYSDVLQLLSEAEQLAKRHEYNDHLASLRLTQGHMTWDHNLPEYSAGFDTALGFYQYALIYALRYNRFLLDEVLWGGNVATPLQTLIPHCQARGEEGRLMLAALRDWWWIGRNDIGTPRPDTISPIPEGISLLEAERIAREREPGDGSPQKTVLEALQEALI